MTRDELRDELWDAMMERGWEPDCDNMMRFAEACLDRLEKTDVLRPGVLPPAPPGDWPIGDPALNAAWDDIMDDDRLRRARSVLSFHEIRLMIGHVHRAVSEACA